MDIEAGQRIMRRVWLVGVGYISQAHAEAIRTLPNTRLQGVIDLNRDQAQAFAARYGLRHVAVSASDALATGEVDAVHVLTPPNLHTETALPFLRAGKPVLIEKPFAVSSDECRTLIGESRLSSAPIGVNQNFVFHPAFRKLLRAVTADRLGKARFAEVIYNVPLRQITARQLGHWMFREPKNILLEQAVHPLSQLIKIIGRIENVEASAAEPREISPGVPFYPAVSLALKGQRLPGILRFAVGENFPFWQVSVVCDDGLLIADILNNRYFTYDRGRWLPSFDQLFSGSRTAGAILREALGNASDFTFSTLHLKRSGDGFASSMRSAIADFHRAIDEGHPPELDGEFGAHLVSVCEEVARAAFIAPVSPRRPNTAGNYDIVVLGGTGFIGAHVLRRLVSEGRRVGVMARNTINLPHEFFDDNVVTIAGDVRRPVDVERAIGRASIVINLAHGGGGRTYQEIKSAMVGSAEVVARACLKLGVRRLIHIGSIASLYLGGKGTRITGATLPDPKSAVRSDYARAKAECDRLLLGLHQTQGLAVCILRPGLVVGENGPPFHGGLGFFNNDQHCIGWNRGQNPLPFVLVEDVAQSILLACNAPGIDGRAYNIVGDVRLSAGEYIVELARATARPLRFHPQFPLLLWFEELGKWGVKQVTGRNAQRPSYRDLLSRGLLAQFDCEDAKRVLGWEPVSDRQLFVDRAINVFGSV